MVLLSFDPATFLRLQTLLPLVNHTRLRLISLTVQFKLKTMVCMRHSPLGYRKHYLIHRWTAIWSDFWYGNRLLFHVARPFISRTVVELYIHGQLLQYYFGSIIHWNYTLIRLPLLGAIRCLV